MSAATIAQRLRQWFFVTLAERGLCTETQAILAHKEGVVQGGIMALRLLRKTGVTTENVDRLESNLLRQLDGVQRERLSDVGLAPRIRTRVLPIEEEALRSRLEAAERVVEAARAAASAPENSDALYDALDDALADYDAARKNP